MTNIALIANNIGVECATVKFNIFFLLLLHPDLEIVLFLFVI